MIFLSTTRAPVQYLHISIYMLECVAEKGVSMIVSQSAVTCGELLKKFPQFFSESIGDLNRSFTAVDAPNSTNPNAAIFLSTPKALQQGLASAAHVIVMTKKFRTQAEASGKVDTKTHTILISANPELAMTMILREFFLATPHVNKAVTGIHPTATVSPDATIASGVRIGPHAFIGAGVKLASGVYIGANSVIEDDVTIGEDTVIHPLVYIGHSTEIGMRCEINPNSTIGKEGFGYAHDEKGNHYRTPHIGRVVLEDDVHLGATTTIDRGTFGESRIGFGAKFDNRVHIGHNSSVGTNSIITAGFLLAGSSKIGANFLAGGNSVVSGHLEVCDNVQLSAFSAVGKAIDKPGKYGGHPLMPLQKSLKMKASLFHLVEMRKQISLILKHLGLETSSTPTESVDEA